MCNYCNSVKADRDEDYTLLFIQLRILALKNHLPFTLAKGDEEEYRVTRRNITGGLSNVHNRKNIRVDTIKNLEYFDDKLHIIDTNNIITHIIGIDFNSLYLSSYSSLHHPFNPYTNGIMYMFGPIKSKITDQNEALRIIKERKEIFLLRLKDISTNVTYMKLSDFLQFL
jgi:hypothetical protein